MNIFFSVSSHTDIEKEYFEDASFLAKELASNNSDLIIGVAMKEGMSGRIIKEFTDNNRKIDLYTLKIYNENPNDFPNINFHYCDSTYERTKKIYNESDILLLMPGGTGTIAEIFSFLEEMRTIKTEKKLILFNRNNYYKEIIQFIKNAIEKKFNTEDIFDYINIIENKEEIVSYIKRR